MASRNGEVRVWLRELAALSVLDDQNPQSFRARAYENAVHALEQVKVELSEQNVASLKKIDGIGNATAKKIREYFDTGRVNKLEVLRERFPPDVVAMSRIPGMGPKTLARIRDELDVHTIVDLKAAIADQRLRDLKGLGAKTEEKLGSAIERLKLTEKRTPIADAMPIARGLVAGLRMLEGVKRAEYCGSLRRMCETIGDIDLLVSATDPERVMGWFVARPEVAEVLVSGTTKTSISMRSGLQIDLRVVADHQYGAALMYFTGSKSHNIKLRARARQRGWTLNEYALTEIDGGAVVASGSEEEIYRALGLPLIPPSMREDSGEIENAEAGTLPEALRPDHLCGDLHVHTTWSGDGRSPLAEVVAAAAARGYRYLAITDHGVDLAMNGVTAEGLLEQREELAALQEQYPQMRLIPGCELNIGRDGGLDYDSDFRLGLSWCVAAVHSHYDLPLVQQTDRILKAMADPSVHVIGHLTGRMIGRRPGIQLDVDAVLQGALDTHTAIEINAALPRLDAAAPVLRKARELGVPLIISTDAHHVREFERVEWGTRHATRGWIAPEQVVNTWSPERFFRWMGKKRSF